MTGRNEHDKHIESVVENTLKGCPKYLRTYYETLWKKSWYTKKGYIQSAVKYLNYLKVEEQINIEDVNEVANVKPSVINKYIGGLNVKSSTRAREFYSIKSLYNFFYVDDLIPFNPVDGHKVEAPRDIEPHDIVYLTEDEINIVKNNILNGVGSHMSKEFQKRWKSRDMLIVMLGLSTGMRVSSISEIDIDDIDLDNRIIRIYKKGNTVQSVRFSEKLIPYINAWLKDREDILKEKNIHLNALLLSNQMNRISTNAIRILLKKYTEGVDKNITPHKLRSTCATGAIKKTRDIYLVAHKLGHTNIETTKRYAAIDDEMEEEAASAMDDILF